MKFILSMTATIYLIAGTAFAQQKPLSAPVIKTANQCQPDQLVFGSGTPKGTYGLMTAKLVEVCPMVCETQETQGGYDNITNLVNEKFDAGIVQSDVIEFLNRTEPDIKKKLRSLFAMHGSSVHLFISTKGVSIATKRIEKGGMFSKDKEVNETSLSQVEKLADTKGKKIAAWSSAFITMNIVNERLKMDWDIVEVKTRKEGFDLVKSGQVWMFAAGAGKPAEWISEAAPAEFTMLNLDPADITKLGAPYYPVKVTYRNLKVNGWNTITVRNEVLVRNVTTGPLAQSISGLKQCITQNLDTIKASRDKHPSWSDVEDLSATTWISYVSGSSAKVAPKKK